METIRETMAISPVFVDDGRAPVAQMAQRTSTPAPTPGQLQAAFRDFLAALAPEDRAIVQTDIRAKAREHTIQRILDSPEARTKARQLFDF